MVWVSIALFVALGVALIIWREELTYMQAASFGANMHPGCAVAEAIALFVLALAFYLMRGILS